MATVMVSQIFHHILFTSPNIYTSQVDDITCYVVRPQHVLSCLYDLNFNWVEIKQLTLDDITIYDRSFTIFTNRYILASQATPDLPLAFPLKSPLVKLLFKLVAQSNIFDQQTLQRQLTISKGIHPTFVVLSFCGFCFSLAYLHSTKNK
jgi:hypothetical protein